MANWNSVAAGDVGTGGIFTNPSAMKAYTDSARPQFWCSAAPCTVPTLTTNSGQKRGYRWADYGTLYTGFTTILPPNTPIGMAVGNGSTLDGQARGAMVAATSSRHPGGAHVAMGDGAIKFITDSIEAGDSTAQPIDYNNTPGVKSPYGLWGALGSRAFKEVIEEEL